MLGFGGAAFAFAPSWGRAAQSESAAPDSGTIQGSADANHHLTIDTYINGQGPFQFVVDTGADQTVIADDVATALGVLTGEEVIVQGISRSGPAPTVQLKSLSFGHVTLNDLRAPVLQRKWLGADGYLGLDAIDGRRVVFDFHNNRLTITSSQSTPERTQWMNPDEALVRVNGSKGRLTALNCRVDGVHADAFIDSGAEASIGNTRLFAELQAIGKTYLSDIQVPVVGVTGGQAFGRLTSIASVRFGTLEFIDSTLIIADLPVFEVWGLADKPAMFLGMNFLRHTDSFEIDYGSKEVLIKVASVRLASAI